VNPWMETIYARSPIALQNLYISLYGRRIRRQRFNPGYERWMELFERSERWTPDELGDHQDRALAALVAHCYERVPFYRKVMDERRLRPADITSRGDLHKLPIVTKDISAASRTPSWPGASVRRT